MTVQTMLTSLIQAFGTTLFIFFFTLLGALPLGLLVNACRKSRFAPLSWLTKIYISIMRGTPLMLQLMVVYFGPSLLLGITVPGNWRSTAVVLAFVINYAAYFAEIYRGGIESIPIGQYEAAQVLGYSRLQTYFKIILPQMVKRVLPPVTNEVITLVKDTSLASVIGVVEMFTRAKQIAVAPHSPGMITFLAAAIFYYVFNYAVAFGMERLEKALDYYE
ncbi:MAG: amino acid ABC transporter permease [Oscillospiraceae bacterium]|nr:amino acid ABC transporter permease [Oscillospiraceae bacterium]